MVFPLTVVALAVAVLIGDGCCAFVSICLGAGERRTAGQSVGCAVTLSIAAGLVLAAVYLIFRDPLLTAFGGRVNEETWRYAGEYFFWITLGVPFYVFGQAMNPVIRSDGSPRFATAATLAGALVNIILDPLFIFGFRWGMMGAAVATVLGQVLTAGLSVWYLCRMQSVTLRADSFVPRGSLAARFLPLGLCSLLSQISLVAAMAAINNMLSRYGALDPVFGQPEYTHIPMAVVGIVMKFFQIVISIAVGMAAGCIPVVGYNIGAGRRDRARRLFGCLLAAEAAVGAVALLVVELLPVQLIDLFGAANESVYYTQFADRSVQGISTQDYLWKIQFQVILELAEKGPCVLVGRCADYILRDRADCLRVFVHADREKRARRIVEVYGETGKAPEERLRDKDKRRASYYEFYTDRSWGDARNFHLALDSGELGIEACAELIARLAAGNP